VIALGKKAVLAFDYGASSGRLVLGILNEDTKKIELKEMHRFKNCSVKLNQYEYWDFPYLYNELKEGLKKVFSKESVVTSENIEVLGLGVDTWGVDYGWIDEKGELLSLPICYRDTRTEEVFEEVHSKVSLEEIFNETGVQFYSFNSVYQIFYDIHKRKVLEKGAKQLQFMPNLFAYFLTGKKSWEYTISSTSGMVNIDNKKWSKKIFEKLDIPESIVGDIEHGGQVLAPLKETIQKELGIKPLNVILTASHDSAAAIAGAPLVENSLYVINGTWSIIGFESDVPVVNEEAFKNNIVNEGGIEKKARVLKMIPGLWILQQLKKIFNEKNLDIDYSDFGNMAKKSNLISFVDLENERFLHAEKMDMEIKAYCRETGQEVPETDEDLLRVAYNSLKKQYNKSIKELEKLVGNEFTSIIAIGGGIQDKFLCQEISDETDRVIKAGPIEASAFGNIITQFIALGLVKNLEEGREIVKNSVEIIEYKSKRKEEK
jgi:hypothetical protein